MDGWDSKANASSTTTSPPIVFQRWRPYAMQRPSADVFHPTLCPTPSGAPGAPSSTALRRGRVDRRPTASARGTPIRARCGKS